MIGVISSEKWNSFSRVEKCTWYWIYVNTYIEKELNKLRVETIKLEQLNAVMNKNIKEKFGVESEFKFSNIIANRSSSYFQKNTEYEQVAQALLKIESHFNIRYYKND
ncbi:hypothetical protein SAMN05660776_2012 [Salegentibacter holothuriorum]|uniref:Uncharacterized protein n=1 Tax=Salegentibacter holothuriorum TaxID=241145 RepID=A0A1T5CKU9_9FLAO|nr:hypothetical protein [Salegentibacter holothuriorum]SKB60112.1 hypothetical protein SAMN05660776_2012 [Salegentibacter holothuriorum]